MTESELKHEVEYAENLAMRLSSHCTLFDGYYNDGHGIEQASIDPECFFTSWNELFEKTDELYGFLKQLVKRMYGRGDDDGEQGV